MRHSITLLSQSQTVKVTHYHGPPLVVLDSADRVKAIRSVLHSADARVKYTEDERPGLHFARDGYDEVLPLDAGLAEYLSSDAGKQFLPPTNVQGTGQNNLRGGGKLTNSEGKFNPSSAVTALLGSSRTLT